MPQRIATSWSAWTAAHAAPISAPSPRINGAGAPSRTTTELPSRRAVAATSSPMNPAPITTTRALPSRRRARRSSASSSVRSSTTCGQVALAGQPARRRPGRDDEPVERDLAPVGDHQPARLDVETGRRCTESPRHAERVEVVGLAELDPVGLPLAGQQLLRQRRSVVRSMCLGADDDQLTVVPAGAQRLDGAQPGQRASDDDDSLEHPHGLAGRAGLAAQPCRRVNVVASNR